MSCDPAVTTVSCHEARTAAQALRTLYTLLEAANVEYMREDAAMEAAGQALLEDLEGEDLLQQLIWARFRDIIHPLASWAQHELWHSGLIKTPPAILATADEVREALAQLGLLEEEDQARPRPEEGV